MDPLVITEAEMQSHDEVASSYRQQRYQHPHHARNGKSAGGAAAGPGRLRDLSLTRHDRSWAIATHLAMIPAVWFLNMLAPLVAVPIYFFVRDRSGFLRDHAREAINLSITCAIVMPLWFVPILGWATALIWMIMATIGAVRGAMAADRGEYFRYPMVFRFVR